MRDFTTWQRLVGQWTDETFPTHYDEEGKPNPRGPVYHLFSEAQELVAALEAGGNIAQECADVTILALTIAHLAGFDLGAEVERKMAVNRARKWGKPDANGMCEHVEGGEA